MSTEPDNEGRKFAYGEWAVFVHDTGARLYQCGQYDPQYTHRIWEYPEKEQFGRITTSHGPGIPESSLVKVKSREEGYALVGLIKFLYDEEEREKYEVAQKFAGKKKRAILTYEVYIAEDD